MFLAIHIMVISHEQEDIFSFSFLTKAVLSQGEPRDAAVNFEYVSNFTTASCGFSATAPLYDFLVYQRPFKTSSISLELHCIFQLNL